MPWKYLGCFPGRTNWPTTQVELILKSYQRQGGCLGGTQQWLGEALPLPVQNQNTKLRNTCDLSQPSLAPAGSPLVSHVK